MLTPAEFIEALRKRQLRSIRPQQRSEGLPAGWQTWLEGSAGRIGAPDSRRAQELVSLVSTSGLSPRVETGKWWRFTPVVLRGWEPPRRDERGLRLSSGTLSFLLHFALILALSWLMHARFALAPDPDTQRGEHVIEVEFIGTGTPEEEGGGADTPQATVEPEPEPEPQPETPVASQPSPVVPPESAPATAQQSEPEPEAAVAEPLPAPADQPLVVTETDVPEGAFQVPPIPPVEIEAPALRAVEIAPRSREIELAQTRDLVAPVIAPEQPAPRELAQPEIQIREREVVLAPAPQALPRPEIEAPQIEVPASEAPVQSARIRDVPMPPAREAEADSGEAAAEPEDSGTTAVAAAEAQQPDAGRGPAPEVRDGGWSSPVRDDDWGDSSRDQAGGQEGTSSLFNPDGSVRLPGEGRVGGGLPPGTITEDYEKIDRMGTWLKRPPTDYEPTSFDRFWVPSESLLQEWVRRSVRTVLIPIPGTNKSIRCDIVTLAVAGGCGIVDPNLQDNPASARPPPDIPFRPELHEDQEGLSDDVWD